MRSKVSNIMNINKHSKGLRLCGRGLENYLQKAGDVSWHVVKLTELFRANGSLWVYFPMILLAGCPTRLQLIAGHKKSDESLKFKVQREN